MTQNCEPLTFKRLLDIAVEHRVKYPTHRLENLPKLVITFDRWLELRSDPKFMEVGRISMVDLETSQERISVYGVVFELENHQNEKVVTP
jgi:hypothetical protein